MDLHGRAKCRHGNSTRNPVARDTVTKQEYKMENCRDLATINAEGQCRVRGRVGSVYGSHGNELGMKVASLDF